MIVDSVQDESAVDNRCYLPLLRAVHVHTSYASFHFCNKVHFSTFFGNFTTLYDDGVFRVLGVVW